MYKKIMICILQENRVAHDNRSGSGRRKDSVGDPLWVRLKRKFEKSRDLSGSCSRRETGRRLSVCGEILRSLVIYLALGCTVHQERLGFLRDATSPIHVTDETSSTFGIFGTLSIFFKTSSTFGTFGTLSIFFKTSSTFGTF